LKATHADTALFSFYVYFKMVRLAGGKDWISPWSALPASSVTFLPETNTKFLSDNSQVPTPANGITKFEVFTAV
jgi:hypothetical protein